MNARTAKLAEAPTVSAVATPSMPQLGATRTMRGRRDQIDDLGNRAGARRTRTLRDVGQYTPHCEKNAMRSRRILAVVTAPENSGPKNVGMSHGITTSRSPTTSRGGDGDDQTYARSIRCTSSPGVSSLQP